MNWSLQIAKFGETAVRIHWTFFLLLAWLGTIFWIESGPRAATQGLVLVLLVFGCVILHEFGHVLAARRYGIKTRNITLWPIGGIASLDRMPEKPSEEIIVALAGPAVNFAIAFAIWLALGGHFEFTPIRIGEMSASSLLAQLASVNLVLAAFNLIPAFPMDGGRVLRALLGFQMGYAKATRTAARAGQTIAILFALLGIIANPFLILIAIFIYLAAGAEAYSVTMSDAAKGHKARDVMITKFESVSKEASVSDAAALLLKTTQHEFPVVDEKGRLLGIVTKPAIIAALERGQDHANIQDAMEKGIPTRSMNESVDAIIKLLQSTGAQVIGVTDMYGRLIGYINQDNLVELMSLEASRPQTADRGTQNNTGPTV